MRIEYLSFNIVILIFSTLGILFTKKTLPQPFAALKAMVIMSIPFLIWDHIVTNTWWSFNPLYTLPIRVFKLPLEEIMFFFTVPWSCLLLWVNIKSLKFLNTTTSFSYILLGLTFCFTLIAIFRSPIYMIVALLSFLLIQILSFASNLFNRNSFLFFAILTLFLTTIFNGYLTSRPVVEYSQAYLSQNFIYTIPFEDYIYGLTLICGNVWLYEKFISTKIKRNTP